MSTDEDSEIKHGTRRSHSASCKPLLDAATPELFRANAFRITGLPVDATIRQITKHADNLKLMEDLGRGESVHTAAFALKPPPTVDKIRDAIQKLKDPERRIVDSCFGSGQSGLERVHRILRSVRSLPVMLRPH